MVKLETIISILCNIPHSKSKLYSIFFDGFLIEVCENKILKWSLKESVILFNSNKKVELISNKSINCYRNYLYISSEKLDEFLNLFGEPSYKAIRYFSKFNYEPKKSFVLLDMIKILYFLISPIMLLSIFLEILFKDNKGKLLFNYYHSVNISEDIYNRMLKSHYPMGFNLEGRKEIIKKTIDKKEELKYGPWLDLGCGINSLLLEAEGDMGAEIYLLDPNPMAEKAYNNYRDKYKNTKIKFISGSGEKLPFEDNFFSFIYCGGVIAHVCTLDKFLTECKRVLKPGGVILFDESNECPRKKFVNSWFSRKLNKKILLNSNIINNYAFSPPENFVPNPWAYWGCSTDHFWIFNLEGMVNYLKKFFNLKKEGGIGSYLSNNGTCEGFPLFYPLDLGWITNLYLDFKNLPIWYLKLINKTFKDTGIYIYSLCQK